jgi:hypothetical protein
MVARVTCFCFGVQRSTVHGSSRESEAIEVVSFSFHILFVMFSVDYIFNYNGHSR